MKKLKIALSLFLFGGLFVFLEDANAQGCTQCNAGMSECYRIIDNTDDDTSIVHVYHGHAVAC